MIFEQLDGLRKNAIPNAFYPVFDRKERKGTPHQTTNAFARQNGN